MKLPSSVKIAGVDWRIRKVRALGAEDGEWLYGKTRVRYARIEINTLQAAAQKRETLVHEILHAIFTNCTVMESHEAEEVLIRQVSPHLLAVLRENPEVIAYLTAPSTHRSKEPA